MTLSPRPCRLALLALVLASGCGGSPTSGEGLFGIDLLVSRAVADQVSSFQIAVLPNGRLRECTVLQERCLRDQVKLDDLLVLRDGNGQEGRALRFPMNLSGTGTSTQEVAVEVPVGRDYALIIEAISVDTPPSFLGSSCNLLTQVNASRNDPVIAAPMTLTPVACNPTIDP
jgi:hypothetical protein